MHIDLGGSAVAAHGGHCFGTASTPRRRRRTETPRARSRNAAAISQTASRVVQVRFARSNCNLQPLADSRSTLLTGFGDFHQIDSGSFFGVHGSRRWPPHAKFARLGRSWAGRNRRWRTAHLLPSTPSAQSNPGGLIPNPTRYRPCGVRLKKEVSSFCPVERWAKASV